MTRLGDIFLQQLKEKGEDMTHMFAFTEFIEVIDQDRVPQEGLYVIMLWLVDPSKFLDKINFLKVSYFWFIFGDFYTKLEENLYGFAFMIGIISEAP